MARIYCIIGILEMINRSALSKCLITLDAQIDLYIEKESWHQPLMRHRRCSEVPGFKDMRYIYPGAPRPGMKKGARGPYAGPLGGAFPARCRPPASGALPSHGLHPQYSRREGA